MLEAIANIVGGFLSKQAQDDANEINRQNAANNIALQRDFAQHGIQWKVEDAKRAGVAPWAALGTSGASFTPVSVGAVASDGLARGLAASGQDLSRSFQATADKETRDASFENTLRKLQIEGAGLDNDIKRATLASSVQRLKSAQVGPPMPTDVPIPTKAPSAINRLYVGGEPLYVDPGTSSAQDIENRYGDDISWMTAPIVGWNDLMHHFGWDGARLSMPPRDYFTWRAWKDRVMKNDPIISRWKRLDGSKYYRKGGM